MKTKILLLALLIIELAARTAFAGPVQLLGDLNQVKSRRSYPFSAQSGTKIFFSRTS
jgi:hypothetical protein